MFGIFNGKIENPNGKETILYGIIEPITNNEYYSARFIIKKKLLLNDNIVNIDLDHTQTTRTIDYNTFKPYFDEYLYSENGSENNPAELDPKMLNYDVLIKSDNIIIYGNSILTLKIALKLVSNKYLKKNNYLGMYKERVMIWTTMQSNIELNTETSVMFTDDENITHFIINKKIINEELTIGKNKYTLDKKKYMFDFYKNNTPKNGFYDYQVEINDKDIIITGISPQTVINSFKEYFYTLITPEITLYRTNTIILYGIFDKSNKNVNLNWTNFK